uniref:Uncharacterized protein n=1 Tax=Anguilla anguilla TaxID=7936 RepID=A0A0E9WHN9_ANGAN
MYESMCICVPLCAFWGWGKVRKWGTVNGAIMNNHVSLKNAHGKASL